MKNKITLLITSSILALIALSAIQAYLISNTYVLKKDAFIKETDDALESFEKIKKLDSISNVWKEDLRNHLNDYKSDRITKAEALSRFFIKTDSLNSIYNKYHQQELKKLDLGYDVDFRKNLINIVIINGDKHDTIFSSNKNNPKKLFGENFNTSDGYQVNKSFWYTESQYIHLDDDNVKTASYDLEVSTLSYIQIKDWKNIVYGRMAAIFIGLITCLNR